MELDLTGLWRFQADPSNAGEAYGYTTPEYDHGRWREVWVPVDFETCHPALDTYEGAAWYRRCVSVPGDWRGKRVTLRFEGVNAHAQVWVNGHQIGVQEDPFLPFSFEIQDTIRFGEETVIAVRVDNERRPGDVPGMQRGWRNFGGILREVGLAATDLCHLSHVVVDAQPREGVGYLRVEALARNASDRRAAVSLDVEIAGEGGDVLGAWTCPAQLLAAGDEIPLEVSGAVAAVERWSPDQPQLYTVRASLALDGTRVDVWERRVGFRSIEVCDELLLLNGKPVYLTGFNRHEDSAERNMCPDPALVRRDLATMKETGANFVRLCHYPHHPMELDLCDELGLLVMDEIPLYWWNGLAEGEEASARKLESARRQLRSLVDRDRHHPSVIFWSVSNETQEDRPEVASGNRELVRLAKSLDPARLAVHVSDHWTQHPNFAEDDIICVNGYPSVGPVANRGETGYDLARSTAFWRDQLALLHERYPGKPILVSEFGYTSFLSVVDSSFSGEMHASVIEHEFAGMDAPYVCGAAIWCWADHAWPPATFEFCGYLAISPYGVLTRNRSRKPAYEMARRLFRAKQGVLAPAGTGRRPAPWPSGYELYMVRRDLENIPQFAFPSGFSIRPMRPDEGGLWTDIWRDAEEYAPFGPSVFGEAFGDDLEALRWRGYLVENEKGVGVATITAWYDRTYKGQDYGLVHWVATRPTYWGRGLGKAMMTHTLNEMAHWHDRALLGTQTKRLPAIKLYLDFGFVPDLDHPWAREAWRDVRDALNHPVLAAMDL